MLGSAPSVLNLECGLEAHRAARLAACAGRRHAAGRGLGRFHRAGASSYGTGAFVSASGHSWLYPPGLPAMLAFLADITGLSMPSVGLAVGQFTLVALLLGMCSALDRHGAGGEGILAMMLAVGVFSKVLDSGWPTVLSLALIPFNLGGLLEVDGPRSGKRLILLLSAVVSAFLHPVGALLLLLLLVADVAAHGLAKGPLDRFRLDIGVLVGLVLLLVGVAMLSQDVRLDAPFAEDGWQGGWPMLAYGESSAFPRRVGRLAPSRLPGISLAGDVAAADVGPQFGPIAS